MTIFQEPHILARFVDVGDWVTESIDFETNSIWPHFEFGGDQSMTPTWIGAHSKGGVQERPFNYCTAVREKWYALPCSIQTFDDFIADCRADIGKMPYNFKDIEGLLLHIRALNDPKSATCSQWGYMKLWNRQFRMLNALPEYAYLVTPEFLHLSPLFLDRCVYDYRKGHPLQQGWRV